VKTLPLEPNFSPQSHVKTVPLEPLDE
jgi:hypothetical protein